MVLRITLFTFVSCCALSAAATEATTPQQEFLEQVSRHFTQLLTPQEFAVCKPLIERVIACFIKTRQEKLSADFADDSERCENELELLSLECVHKASLAHHLYRRVFQIKYHFGLLTHEESQSTELLIKDIALALCQMYAQRIQELSGLRDVDLFPSFECCIMRAARTALASRRDRALEVARTFVNGFTIDVVPAGGIVESVGAGVASSGCRSRGKSKVAPTGFSAAETGTSFIAKNDGF